MIPALPTDLPSIVRLNAPAIADAITDTTAPGSLLLNIHPDQVSILAAGTPESVNAPGLPTPDRTIDLPGHLLIPALVNAHTHLDLTHIGPVAHDPADGFVAWVDHIRSNRRSTPEGIADSVRAGIGLSVAGGSVAVGDIAGAPAGRFSTTPARVLAASRLAGVSFLEFFGIGTTAPGAIERLERFAREDLPEMLAEMEQTPVRFGLQPHAPNTVDLGVYRWVAALGARHGLPLSTHLGETIEEREFIRSGTGPQRAMLERFGFWDPSVLHHVGKGLHPVAHLGPVLRSHRVLCAHVNDATDHAIAVLAGSGTPVVYCPRASAYFGADRSFGPHRYRDMLSAGVRVCLGTDSIVNLDTPDRISVLDEMRLLHRRDGTDRRTLLAMGTINGAAALGLSQAAVTLAPGPLAGLLALPIDAQGPRGAAGDPWARAMSGNAPPTVLFLNRESF